MNGQALWLFHGIPLAAAIALLVVRKPPLRRAVATTACLALFAAAVWLTLQVRLLGPLFVHASALPAPFAIGAYADLLSAVMLAVTAFLAGLTALLTPVSRDGDGASPYFHPLLMFLCLGLNGVFLAADLFNLYVWFEVMLTASFGMLVIRHSRARVEGAVKYLALNLLASALLLGAIAILYALTGTLNLAVMAVALDRLHGSAAVDAAAMLLWVALGLKSAVFPLYFWLPASYHTLPAPVGALFAGIMSKVGVYAFLRLFTLLFPDVLARYQAFFLAVAALTMVSGVLGAIAQYGFRRLLAFHAISQIGYLYMGIALGTQAGIGAAVYFIVHVAIAKAALFFAAGSSERIAGSGDLRQMGGLSRSHPALAACFLLGALSLAGFPPLSGFWAKLLVIRAGFAAGAYAMVACALAVSVLTLFSMVKIWIEAFWKPAPGPQAVRAARLSDWAPQAALLGCVIALGIFVEPGLRLATSAADALLTRTAYLHAVLGQP